MQSDMRAVLYGYFQRLIRSWFCLDRSKQSHKEVEEVGVVVIAAVFAKHLCSGNGGPEERRSAGQNARRAFDLYHQLCACEGVFF